MKKYIAIEQSKEFFDFDLLVDDDGIRSAGGLNCEVFGISCDYPRDYVFLNEDLYKDISDTMDSIVGEFDDLTDLKDRGFTRSEIAEYHHYRSYKEIISDLLYDERYRKYCPNMVKELKEFAENYGNDHEDDIVEFLTITTGKKWVCKQYNGYCQRDVVYIIYCADIHTKEYMDFIGNAAVGCIVEYCISENPIDLLDEDNEERDIDDIVEDTLSDCCYGFYLIDTDAWHEDRAKAKLAEYFGCKADEMELIVIESSYSVTRHNYKIA